uniref:Uncharacterized protein n=1 Tax=Strongyloides venezuelensis TaxID=75913 RepID=A0A0K0FQJ5_STRVS
MKSNINEILTLIGLTLCGMYNNIQIQSERNFVVIVHDGIDDNCKLIRSNLEVKNESNTLLQYQITLVTEHMTTRTVKITTTTASNVISPMTTKLPIKNVTFTATTKKKPKKNQEPNKNKRDNKY